MASSECADVAAHVQITVVAILARTTCRSSDGKGRCISSVACEICHWRLHLDRVAPFVNDAQDWLDIDFAVQNKVDFIAVSFVKSADVMNNLKSYVRSRSPSTIEIVAKIESFDSVPNVQVRHA